MLTRTQLSLPKNQWYKHLCSSVFISKLQLQSLPLTSAFICGKKLRITTPTTNQKISFLTLFFLILLLPTPLSANPQPNLKITVNSNQDSAVQPDEALTLREAIEIVNGTLPLDRLSPAEKTQILPQQSNSRIEFTLPAAATSIRLTAELPPLTTPGLVIDGTTQPGYDASRSATAEIAIPIPVVVITPERDRTIFRGFTVVADNITIRGLSLYGFNSPPQGATLPTPPADIFISHPFPPPNTRQQPPNSNFPFSAKNLPPQGILIEQNWLGIPPNETMPSQTSAFGVSVFNSLGTTIRRNRIANHEGSAIITAVRAENLLVTENIIVGNGIAGMPDALRLEGMINNTKINANLICGNDGSGVYLFKPQGQVQIQQNQILFNGRRLRRAAVYLMGSGHQVNGNQIRDQAGPGVVVSSFPPSDRNQIQNNRFSALEGLSIDLNTGQNLDPIHFQIGDGINPPRNSPNRRQDTGNAAINAPQFISSEWLILNGNVNIQGTADPGSQVEIYRVTEPTNAYGSLSEVLTTVATDEQGKFTARLSNLQPGDRLSAIATHPQYGTSEPALNAVVRAIDGTNPTPEVPQPVIPRCTTAPVPPEPPPVQPPPEPLRIQVPRNIHFALDKATISQPSAAVLAQVVAVLQQYPFIVVEIQGYTDPRASDAYNLALGNRRALSVRNYLLRQGIAPERLTLRSFGEKQRLTTGSSPLDYARDRRVELIFKDVRGLDLIIESQENDLQLESHRGRR